MIKVHWACCQRDPQNKARLYAYCSFETMESIQYSSDDLLIINNEVICRQTKAYHVIIYYSYDL